MTPETEPVDPVERLLEECLDVPDDRRQNALNRLCARHPQHAEELRDRYRQLLDAGLLESPRSMPGPSLNPGPSFGEIFGGFHLARALTRGGGGGRLPRRPNHDDRSRGAEGDPAGSA